MKTNLLFSFFTVAILSVLALPCSAQILHLEIGAANYSGEQDEKRFFVLEETFKNLIAQYGPTGTIYLNDIDTVGLPEAMQFSKYWLAKNGYQNVHVVVLPGDMRTLKIPEKMKTMHMSNPGQNQLPGYIQGIDFALEMAQALGRLAEYSESGLRISTYFHPEFYENLPLLENMLEDSFRLLKSQEVGWPYYLNKGAQFIPESPARVYYLQKKGPQKVANQCSKIFQNPKYLEHFKAYRRKHGGFAYW